METRRLGGSDLDVSRVVLGAWAIGGSMWGGQDAREAEDAIRASLDAGVNCIDTAPVYGMGASEELVGRALRGRRDGVIVATKCGLRWDGAAGTFKFTMTDVDGSKRAIHNDLAPARIRQECEDSLRRLGVDVIDLYQIHWPDPARPVDEAMGELVKLREAGKIRWIGASNFSAEQLAVAKRTGGVVSDQPQYSLVERGIERDVLPLCRRENIGLIVYSPMARGLLSGKYGRDHVFPANDHRGGTRWAKPETMAKLADALAAARPIADRHGITLANLAVAWVLAQPGITAAIVGARDAAQARENARAAEVTLDPDEVRRLGALFEGV
jgi:aryl-alcohol dehydrogenase-like predicted oxidoreductase